MVDEARQILNVSSKAEPEEIQKVRQDGALYAGTSVGLRAAQQAFEHMFARNDPDKGGSLYVQSKFLRAKEALEEEDAAKVG